MEQGIAKDPGTVKDGSPEHVTCPRCGKTFTCSGSSDCWCATMKLSDELRSYLASHYDTCVCRECLEELSATSQHQSPDFEGEG